MQKPKIPSGHPMNNPIRAAEQDGHGLNESYKLPAPNASGKNESYMHPHVGGALLEVPKLSAKQNKPAGPVRVGKNTF
jgi:hypothetical protein